jgi:hypothetical protein
MAFFGDFRTGFSIGRHIARDRTFGGHSQASAQRELREGIIQQLYPGPVSATVQWGIRLGENVFLTLLSVVGFVIVAWAVFAFR